MPAMISAGAGKAYVPTTLNQKYTASKSSPKPKAGVEIDPTIQSSGYIKPPTGLPDVASPIYTYTPPPPPAVVMPPTYSPSYFMPAALNQLMALSNQKPQINTKQLQSMANTAADAQLRPEIQALQAQINGLVSMQKTLPGQTQQQYMDAARTLQQSASQAADALMQQVLKQGGPTAGVQEALDANAQQQVAPQVQQLMQQGQLDAQALLDQLKAQQQAAQTQIQVLNQNKGNISKAQYNALYNDAVNRWQQAQSNAAQILQGVASLQQAGAVDAAKANQERIASINDTNQQLYQNQVQVGQLETQAKQLQQQLAVANNVQKWISFLETRKGPADMQAELDNNQDAILKEVGPEGFMQLQDYVTKAMQTPGYQGKYFIPMPVNGTTALQQALNPTPTMPPAPPSGGLPLLFYNIGQWQAPYNQPLPAYPQGPIESLQQMQQNLQPIGQAIGQGVQGAQTALGNFGNWLSSLIPRPAGLGPGFTLGPGFIRGK